MASISDLVAQLPRVGESDSLIAAESRFVTAGLSANGRD